MLAQRLADELGRGGPGGAVVRDLLARYREPHRAYHDERHLTEVVSALDLLSGSAVTGPVLLAAAWHDAVYDPRAADNEDRSARLAGAALAGTTAAPAAEEVARLVRLTAAHDPDPDDAAGALLCDADLAVLGAGPQRYAEYAAGVRAEYAHLPEAAFRTGRTEVLAGLLGRPHLYATAGARRRWERAARRNLERELLTLRAGD